MLRSLQSEYPTLVNLISDILTFMNSNIWTWTWKVLKLLIFYHLEAVILKESLQNYCKFSKKYFSGIMHVVPKKHLHILLDTVLPVCEKLTQYSKHVYERCSSYIYIFVTYSHQILLWTSRVDGWVQRHIVTLELGWWLNSETHCYMNAYI